MKNILMVASAVSPRWGSEGYVGWSCLNNTPADSQVTLLTTPLCRREVQWGISNNNAPSNLVRLIDPSTQWDFKPRHPLLIRLNQSIKARYDLKAFYRIVKNECHAGKVDIIHQTTIASWRYGMPYHAFDRPTVWGPIGGGELFPWQYAKAIGKKTLTFEILRTLNTCFMQRHPRILQAVRNVDVIICTNRQTGLLLKRMGRVKPILLQQNVLTRNLFDTIQSTPHARRDDKLMIFTGGSMEDRKGYPLLLQALKDLHSKKTVPFHLTIGGHGLELANLIALVERLNLQTCVTFKPSLSQGDFHKTLRSSHVFAFPSLRDNSPITLLESMAAGCVPLVLMNGGPGELVDDSTGIVLPLKSPRETVIDIAHHLLALYNNQTHQNTLSHNATNTVRDRYLGRNLRDTLSMAYELAINTAV